MSFLMHWPQRSRITIVIKKCCDGWHSEKSDQGAESGEGALRQAGLVCHADFQDSFRVSLAGRGYHDKAPRPGRPGAKFADCFYLEPRIFVGINLHFVRQSLIIENSAKTVDVCGNKPHRQIEICRMLSPALSRAGFGRFRAARYCCKSMI